MVTSGRASGACPAVSEDGIAGGLRNYRRGSPAYLGLLLGIGSNESVQNMLRLPTSLLGPPPGNLLPESSM